MDLQCPDPGLELPPLSKAATSSFGELKEKKQLHEWKANPFLFFSEW
jgi:hypothetical protein